MGFIKTMEQQPWNSWETIPQEINVIDVHAQSKQNLSVEYDLWAKAVLPLMAPKISSSLPIRSDFSPLRSQLFEF